MILLVQFLLKLTFGLAAGMAFTSPRYVTSGYYRNHLYVTLGLASLASLLSWTVAPAAFWPAVLAAVLSYFGSVCWLIENSRLGRASLVLVAGVAIWGLFNLHVADSMSAPTAESSPLDKYFAAPPSEEPLSTEAALALDEQAQALGLRSGVMRALNTVTSGLLLGVTMAAMLLGHWYLNSPSMELIPLRRLIVLMGVATAVQMVVSGAGLGSELAAMPIPSTQWLLFVLLRWSFGLVGVAALAWMAWQTLKIPNTQSATGILYVAVIGTFVGETMALLLSAETLFPL